MRRVLAPKWWGLHIGVLIAVLVMLRLGLWQWHRANSASGGIQNYAYAFQWPLFAGLAIVLWFKTLQEEVRRDPDAGVDDRPAPQQAEADIVRQPGFVIGVRTPALRVPDADEDPEVAAWNARLAALNAAHASVERRRR
jgi:DNA-binding transcriptional regulator of glucitol operon